MAAHLPSAEVCKEEPLQVQGYEAMDICRPDTPSTVSEAASELQSTAPVLDYPNNINVEEQQPLNTPINPPQAMKTRSSVYRGVCWNKKNKRWQSAINNGGRYVYLGSYVEELEAARAFDLAALQIRGSTAKLNFNIEDYPENDWKSGAPPHLIEKYRAAKPGTTTTTLDCTKTALGMRPMEPFALPNFKVDQNRIPNLEEVLSRGRSSFALAEREFLRDSISSFPSIRVKQETEPIGVIPGYPTTPQLSFARTPGIQYKYPTNSALLAASINETRPNQKRVQNRFFDSAHDKQGPHEKQGLHEEFDDSANYKKGHHYRLGDSAGDQQGRVQSQRKCWDHFDDRPLDRSSVKRQKIEEMQMSTPSTQKSNLPVPVLQPPPTKGCRSLQVASVLPESVQGSDVEAAKLIVGSSRNHFGLLHRTSSKAKWSSLVWDGDTMHDMGAYATEHDAQVACVAAVQLIEEILSKSG